MKRVSLLATLALACAFSACKKDNEKPKSKTDMLTAKSWKITADVSTEVGANGQTITTDEYARYPACDKDDYLKFQTDKKLISNQGTLKCDPTSAQEQTGAWDFNSDQTKLTIADPTLSGLVLQADIVELTASTLKIKTSSGSGNTLETETITFTAF
jgi:hypothetical protein